MLTFEVKLHLIVILVSLVFRLFNLLDFYFFLLFHGLFDNFLDLLWLNLFDHFLLFDMLRNFKWISDIFHFLVEHFAVKLLLLLSVDGTRPVNLLSEQLDLF